MQETRVLFVLDSSGSMSRVRDETIEGFNSQLRSYKEAANSEHKIYVTLVDFNTHVNVAYQNLDVFEAPNLDVSTYVPSGGTAMYDAVGEGVNLILKEASDELAFLVVVLSDGLENASREFSGDDISNLVTELQNRGDWTFTYMIANQDLSEVTGKLGVMQGNVMNYTSSKAGTSEAFTKMADSGLKYLNARSSGAKFSTSFYED